MSEPEMRIIMSSENWETVRQEGGDLVAVAVSPGVFVKMKRAEAEKKGLIGKEAAEAATTNRKRGRRRGTRGEWRRGISREEGRSATAPYEMTEEDK